jgi:hypothetical protein
MLGATILASQIITYGIPGVQLVMILLATITLTYRWRALIPIYVYVLLYLQYFGFFAWNLPYLYIWIPLWSVFMLAGKLADKFRLPNKIRVPLYMILCGLCGLSFGTLYAPFWALIAGLSFNQTLAWIAAGLPVDFTYAVCNFAAGILIVPLSELLKKLNRE